MIAKILLLLIALLGLAFTFGSEDSFKSNISSIGEDSGEVISIAYTNWDSDMAESHVIAEVLRQQGFRVRMTPVEVAPMFESVASGQADALVVAWLPATHGSLYDENADRLEDLGPNILGTKTGLVVPSYMEVNSIEDLSDEAGQVITGIEPGAGQSAQVDQALEDYSNLEGWKHQTSSAGAMLSELESAYANQEEIIVSGWSPHWKFVEYDLKFLEDPRGSFGGGDNVHTLVRLGLAEDMPRAYQILDNFEMELEDLQSIMFAMYNGAEVQTAAEEWIAANQDRVAEWIDTKTNVK